MARILTLIVDDILKGHAISKKQKAREADFVLLSK